MGINLFDDTCPAKEEPSQLRPVYLLIGANMIIFKKIEPLLH